MNDDDDDDIFPIHPRSPSSLSSSSSSLDTLFEQQTTECVNPLGISDSNRRVIPPTLPPKNRILQSPAKLPQHDRSDPMTSGVAGSSQSSSSKRPLPKTPATKPMSKPLPKTPAHTTPAAGSHRLPSPPLPLPQPPQPPSSSSFSRRNEERESLLDMMGPDPVGIEWRMKCNQLERENQQLRRELEQWRRKDIQKEQRHVDTSMIDLWIDRSTAKEDDLHGFVFDASDKQSFTVSRVLSALDACASDRVIYTPDFREHVRNAENSKYMTEQERAYHNSRLRPAEDSAIPDGNNVSVREMFHICDERSRAAQLISGSCSMRQIRSVEQKRNLLSEALDPGHNRDAIISILFHCEQTLDFDVFVDEILLCDRRALCMYEQVLDQWRQYEQLVKLYRRTGMRDREAALMLRRVVREARDNPSRQFDMLEQCMQFFREHQHSHSYISEHVPLLEFQLKLMSRQIRIERNDRSVAAGGKEPIFKRWPRSNIFGTPAQHLLWYSLFYHSSLDARKLSSPRSVAELLGVGDRRYLYTAIEARLQAQDWSGVQRIVPTSRSAAAKITKILKKGSSGSGASSSMSSSSSSQVRLRKNCPLSLEEIIDMARRHHGPIGLLEYLFSLWQDHPRRKLECAMQQPLVCYHAAIDALIQTRDREQLEQLRHVIVEEMGAQGSSSFRDKIDAALGNPKMKWSSQRGSVTGRSLFGKVFNVH